MTDAGERRLSPKHVLVVRMGHGGNCSSVGSVVDTLFLGAAAGGALLAAVCAAMQSEEIHVVGDLDPVRDPDDDSRSER